MIQTPQIPPVQYNGPRKYCPVFVVGCHRSGTNLLYDTLLSAGGFAVYRGYLPIYKMLIPKFGQLGKLENRKKILDTWIRSKGFRRSGLDSDELIASVISQCKTGGDFMRIVMNAIAKAQNVSRWAVYDPDNLLHMSRIKMDIPDALFVHIVRDGRDIALSLEKMGGFTPIPWSRSPRGLEETALYWQWMIRRGREYGRKIQADYLEIHYEDLVTHPQNVLSTLRQFLDHDLDFEHIQRSSLGSLSRSNSSFKDERASQPLNRWQERLSPDEVAGLEKLVGGCLREFGYKLMYQDQLSTQNWQARCMSAVYTALLSTKLWAKTRTPLGKMTDLAELELQDAALT
jgi:hypothetical protein